MANRTKEDVLAYLERAEVAAVGTSNMGMPRQRMMHFAADEDFNIYLTSMKGDPKIIQWSNVPHTAMLIHQGDKFMEMEECEIIGRAEVLKTKEDREKAIGLLVDRSPIVNQFHHQGSTDRLDFIRVRPFTVKYRYVPEILQGIPPTVFEFHQNKETYSKWDDIKSKMRAWKEAIRPLSLTASLIPLLLGAAIAYGTGTGFNWGLFILTLLGGLMIQAGTNMINDWKDADRDQENVQGIRPFTGGSKMIQLGLISRADMGFFGMLMSGIAAIIGIYLMFQSGWGLLPLILYGLLAGAMYTGEQGKFSFINMTAGVAEFLIATTYGVFMTLGAYYVQTGHFSWEVFLISLPVAILVTNVLLINQFQDADSDAKTKKNTLVVRLGKQKSKNVLIAFFIIAYAIIAILPLIGVAPMALYFAFLSLPFAIQAMRYTQKNYDKTSIDLISGNAHTAIAHLFSGLLLVFAYLLQNQNQSLALPLVYLAGAFILVAWVWTYIERKKKDMDQFRLAMKK